eukprot:TRINITY_DN6604_c0_g1_i1.p1 TRINITY_DN6604_c0_g1~~TRINITY_DN6604_c0_g1_i1.p1  ORF type:complete len:197 (-),score=-31.36 TRINITY_DN6604_c0_g1_i1:20-610(-)
MLPNPTYQVVLYLIESTYFIFNYIKQISTQQPFFYQELIRIRSYTPPSPFFFRQTFTRATRIIIQVHNVYKIYKIFIPVRQNVESSLRNTRQIAVFTNLYLQLTIIQTCQITITISKSQTYIESKNAHQQSLSILAILQDQRADEHTLLLPPTFQKPIMIQRVQQEQVPNIPIISKNLSVLQKMKSGKYFGPDFIN